MSRRNLKTLSLFLLVLLGGVALGAWGMRAYFTHTLGNWDPAERLLVKLGDDLSLDADQRLRVAGVLTDQKTRMEGLRSLWKVDVRLLARTGEDRIAGILTPQQMDAFVKRHDSIHGRMVRFLWLLDSGPTAIAVSPEVHDAR